MPVTCKLNAPLPAFTLVGLMPVIARGMALPVPDELQLLITAAVANKTAMHAKRRSQDVFLFMVAIPPNLRLLAVNAFTCAATATSH